MEEGRMLLAMDRTDAMEALVRIGNPDCALLYAYLCTRGGEAEPESAAADLRWEPERLRQTRQMLTVFGLARDGAQPPLRPKEAPRPEELAAARRGDPAFSGLCAFFEQQKGNTMTQREMTVLLDVYQNLNLPADVLALLIGWCRENGHFSIRTLESEAYRWHDRGIDTFARAEEYLNLRRQQHGYGTRALGLFGIQGRRPSDTEQKYLEQWRAWGVSEELLRLAYDKTVTNTGKLSWRYLHTILSSWHDQGFQTLRQVESGDRRPAQRPTLQTAESAESRILKGMEQRRQAREQTLNARLAELRALSPDFKENESSLRLCASRMARCGTAPQRVQLEEERQRLLTRQAGILQRLGKPADWLTDRPDCPKCGDRGYVGSQKCTCLLEALDSAEKAGV